MPSPPSSQRTWSLAVFDFDGTLADSFPFFVSALGTLAARHGFAAVSPEDALALRHLGAREIMRRVGLPAWRLPFVARSFIGLMREASGRIPAFAGVHEVLRALSEAGVTLALVTSNSRDNVERVLSPDTFRRFSHVECGASIFGKARRLRRVVGRAGVAATEAIYLGDQIADLEAARSARLAFGAVAWGYGSIESLRAGAPDAEFNHVGALLGLLGQAVGTRTEQS